MGDENVEYSQAFSIFKTAEQMHNIRLGGRAGVLDNHR